VARRDLLRAFNAGDISQYEGLVRAHHAKLGKQPALPANATFLMSLTVTAHRPPSGVRTFIPGRYRRRLEPAGR
jgi:hypothetical protein